MRIVGQVLTEGSGAPVAGALVVVARRGAGNALLRLTTNARGEFESELSDDFLGEPVLVLTATRAGFLESRLERVPGPEMEVALGLRPERPVQPPPPPQPPPVRPPAPPPPAPVQVGWFRSLFRAFWPSLFLCFVIVGGAIAAAIADNNDDNEYILFVVFMVVVFGPVCTLLLAWRDRSIRESVRRELQGKGQ